MSKQVCEIRVEVVASQVRVRAIPASRTAGHAYAAHRDNGVAAEFWCRPHGQSRAAYAEPLRGVSL
jgi:hypothetical protein